MIGGVVSMIQAARKKKIHIGPADHGRPMRLDDFADAIAEEGYLYELAKGVIEVSEVPKLEHGRQVEAIRNQLVLYQASHDGIIEYLAASNDAKLLIGRIESERHPDLFIYTTPAPQLEDPWSQWIPSIVIEVVSPSSRKRDYEENPGEYLELGIDEYWIVDAAEKQMTVLSRWRGQWKSTVVKPSKKYTTHWLPGFSLDLKRVIEAGKKTPRR
jgi:Uma2 family endonuclease